MNLAYLFEIQAGLDAHIMDEHPELKDQDNLDWKILALQVELGECANEWRGFKKWSNDQEPRNFEKCYVCNGHGQTMIPAFPSFEEMDMDMCPSCQGEGVTGKNPLLEEYVDCLHFILSIGLELNPKEITVEDAEPMTGEFKSVLEAFRHVFNWTVNLDYILFEEPFKSDYRIERTYFNLFTVFITLGEMLGFTWEQIEQAYLEKNKVNHERQVNGY